MVRLALRLLAAAVMCVGLCGASLMAADLRAEGDMNVLPASTMAGSGPVQVADGECDPGCCDPCSALGGWDVGCREVCPCWTVTAGGLFLQRSSPDAVVLASNPTNPAEQLNASQFDFDFRGGYEVGLTRHDLLCGADLEAKYFAVDGWTQGALATSSGPTQIHFMPPLPLGIPGARDITSRYTSELHSLELNLSRQVRCLPACRWLAGFRYVELDESLGIAFADPLAVQPTVTHNVNVRNRLYGFQVGGDLDVQSRDRCGVRGFVKAGVYGNAADHAAQLVSPPNTFPYGNPNNQVSFVGETGISAHWRLCDSLALRADYRVMWVDGVAVAGDQIAATSVLALNQGIDTTGGAFYHGVFVGLDWSF